MSLNAPSIFVQIASYRDPECQWTVKDLFEKAERPDRITVGICWQCDPAVDADCFRVPSPRPAQTKVISVLPSEANGVCWARAETQKLFADEDYVLMIDSHMRFIPGWDRELIAELLRCESAKPFLSTYPPGYKPPDRLEQNPMPIVMRAKPFNEQGDIRFDGETLRAVPEKPLRGAFLAAGLLFAPGKFVREVPYDPYMYFDHEEITLAARAFTQGWDVFSPTKAFVYHYYNEPAKGETRALHWNDRKDWTKFQKISRQRYNYLLCGAPPEDKAALADIGRYGLGSVRSLADFEAFSGLDFRSKVASERARKSEFIDGLDRYRFPPAAGRAAPEAGDLLPPQRLKDGKGGLRDIPPAKGKPCIACILPADFDAYVRDFFALFADARRKFEALGVSLVFIAPVAEAELAAYRMRTRLAEELLADEGLAFARLLGAEGQLRDTPLSCAIDRDGRIRGLYDNRNAQNHMADLLRAAEAMAKQAA